MTTHDVDAVVIGAGHNGLVAATLLADAGWDVVVLEAQEQPGGAVKSASLVPGYTSDLYSAFYSLSVASPVLRELGSDDHGLRWTHAPAVIGHPRGAADVDAGVLHRDIDRTATELERRACGDGRRWGTSSRSGSASSSPSWRRCSLVPTIARPGRPAARPRYRGGAASHAPAAAAGQRHARRRPDRCTGQDRRPVRR